MPAGRSTREGSLFQWFVLALFLIICLAAVWWIFKTGYRLKT
jgi:cbb3-type cytochrome oxidase subunit 3